MFPTNNIGCDPDLLEKPALTYNYLIDRKRQGGRFPANVIESGMYGPCVLQRG